jgi:SAM-dependent methyltransferase
MSASGHEERLAGSTARSLPIEVDVSPDVLAKMLARIAEQWSRLGETEPHWSVLTDDAWRSDKIGQNEEHFYASGRTAADLLSIYEQRGNVSLRRGSCLELGCGVGRITVHLARQFERVTALDISPGNLAVCRERLAREGLTNVECRLVRRIDDFDRLPQADVFFSVIALQHNCPPIQKEILSRILPNVNACLFQTITNWPEYTFRASDYLKFRDEVMELHSLPQHVILDLLAKAGLSVREVVSDAWVDHYGSNTFFAVRGATSPRDTRN